MRELYRSENGDVWLLGQDPNGLPYVKHMPNASSGGVTTHIEVGAFLAKGHRSPEHMALLRLIGGLVRESGSTLWPCD